MRKTTILLLSVMLVALAVNTMSLGCGEGGDQPDSVSEPDNRSFYELSYDRATNEQREQLEAIFADDSIGLIGEWKRDVLITLGELPADTPRLTAQDAANLYGNVEYDNMENEFNEIAGAPDFVGGSGIHRSIYFLNDERTEAVILMLNDVYHIVYNEDGTKTRLPVGNQKLPPEPGPSVGPNIDNTVGIPNPICSKIWINDSRRLY